MEHLGDNVVNFFKKAAIKLEEFQVQESLGEAELNDKWEEIKKDTLHKYAEIKAKIKGVIKEDKEEFTNIKSKLEHLEVQLALGKAETKDKIHEQKKEIKTALNDLKQVLKS